MKRVDCQATEGNPTLYVLFGSKVAAAASFPRIVATEALSLFCGQNVVVIMKFTFHPRFLIWREEKIQEKKKSDFIRLYVFRGKCRPAAVYHVILFWVFFSPPTSHCESIIWTLRILNARQALCSIIFAQRPSSKDGRSLSAVPADALAECGSAKAISRPHHTSLMTSSSSPSLNHLPLRFSPPRQ